MHNIRYFFWFCSGANRSLLKRCPTESSKYTGVGATVLFTGIFAALAGAYAIFTVFDNYWAAIGFGLLWGAMIFNLDRYIVSSMLTSRKSNPYLMALPRLVLALLIAIVISKPLELKIFEKEILEELDLISQALQKEKEELIQNRYASKINTLNQEIELLNEEINTLRTSRDTLMIIAQKEADGTGGTMQRNAGPIYRIKKENLDRAEEELAAAIERNVPLIRQKRLELVAVSDSIKSEITALGKVQFDGMAARLQALGNLTTKNPYINLANWFILLLFIAIETAPVLVKLMAPSGPYDDLLAVHEKGFELYREEKITVMEREKDTRLGILIGPESSG